tara:strand:- start:17010 stop:17327 length:318 start_codon:yes stop_codon:yes gene_type:complete
MKKEQLYKLYYNMLLMMSMKTVGFTQNAEKSGDEKYIKLFNQDMEEMAELIDFLKDELIKMYDGNQAIVLEDMEKYIYSDPFYEITKERSGGYNPNFDMDKLEIN